MSSSPPYAVRLLALSHARAWPTAAWTGAATALGTGLSMAPTEWALLAVLVVVCGGAVRMTTAHLVDAWLTSHPDGVPAVATSEYDAATLSAVRAVAHGAPVPPTRP